MAFGAFLPTTGPISITQPPLAAQSAPTVQPQSFSANGGLPPMPTSPPAPPSQLGGQTPGSAPGGYTPIGTNLDFNSMRGAAGALQGLGGDPSQAMANLGNDYQNAYLAYLSGAQQQYGDIAAGYQQTGATQRAGEDATIAGYGALGNQVQGMLQGSDAAQRQAIADQYAGLQGSNTQSNTDRGLGNTTIQNSTSRGLSYDQAKANVDLSSQFAQLQANYASQIGQAGLNYQGNAINADTGEANQQLNWMNSVNIPPPSVAPYAQLATQFGAMQQGNANRALQGQQLGQQGQLAQQGLDQAAKAAAAARGTPGPVNTGGMRLGSTTPGNPGLFADNNVMPTPTGGSGVRPTPPGAGVRAGGAPIFGPGGAAYAGVSKGGMAPPGGGATYKGGTFNGGGPTMYQGGTAKGSGMGNPDNTGYYWDDQGNLVNDQVPAGETRSSPTSLNADQGWLGSTPQGGGSPYGGDQGWLGSTPQQGGGTSYANTGGGPTPYYANGNFGDFGGDQGWLGSTPGYGGGSPYAYAGGGGSPYAATDFGATSEWF